MVTAQKACTWMCVGILFLWLVLPFIITGIVLLLIALGIMQPTTEAIVQVIWSVISS